MGIVFNCDRMLFRRGRLAMSLDCCCIPVPCCGDCYFPVSGDGSIYKASGGTSTLIPEFYLENGGPTQITNYRHRRTVLVQGSGIYPAGFWGELHQRALSYHYASVINVSDCPSDLIVRYASRCFFDVYCETEYSDGDVGDWPFPETLAYESGMWSVTQFGAGAFPGLPGGSTAPGTCNRFELVYEWEHPTEHSVNREECSFDITGATSWPDGMTCGPANRLIDADGNQVNEGDLPAGSLYAE